jgi:two-component system sensor histidine kinase BaeS
MLRSLRVRLVVFLLVPVLVAGGLALGLTTRSVTSYERAQTQQRLQEQGPGVVRQFAEAARKAFDTDGPPKPINIRTFVRQITRADIWFVPNPDYAQPYPGGNVAAWPGVKLDWAKLDRGQQMVFEATPPGGEKSLTVVSGVFLTHNYRPAADGDIAAFGAIILTRPLASLAPPQSFWASRLAPAFLAAGAAALVLALLAGFAITAPLRRLVAATSVIAQGNYRVRLDSRRRDEIGKLNRAFEDMARQLQAAREHERLFLMHVSHELRTPLTAIRGHVAALADGIVDTPDGQAAAYDVIGLEAARLERLIGDLLDLAKLEADRFTLRHDEVDLDELLGRCEAAHREAARAGDLDLELRVGDVGAVAGDGDRILQIVSNLVENAVRWTPPGGIVRISAAPSHRGVRIEVADSGPGVPRDRRTDVFRPFVSEGRGGTGLGLAIASELATAMGGTLAVGDAPEGGALFVCELPRASGGVPRPLAPIA